MSGVIDGSDGVHRACFHCGRRLDDLAWLVSLTTGIATPPAVELTGAVLAVLCQQRFGVAHRNELHCSSEHGSRRRTSLQHRNN